MNTQRPLQSFTQSLGKPLVGFVAVVAVVLIIQAWSGFRDREKIKIYAFQKIEEIKNIDGIKVIALKASRGDYVVAYRQVPFQERRWTINRISGDIVPWQPQISR